MYIFDSYCCLTPQLNWNGFPAEIPGTVDLHHHAHPYGLFLKSHEDTVACLDTWSAITHAVKAATGQDMPVGYFLNDRAWAFLHSNMQAMRMSRVDDCDTHQLSCYAHFMRSLDKADCLMKEQGHFLALQQDIREIHDITWKAVGEVSVSLLAAADDCC